MDNRYLFTTLAAQLLEYLASRGLTFGQPVPLLRACCPFSRCIWLPAELTFGQPVPLLRACCPFSRSDLASRGLDFWAAGTSSPRLLPIFSCIRLPANLVLGSQHLFSALAAQLLEYLASRELAFGRLAPLLRVCCPNILPTDHCGTGFGTFKTQNRGDQPTSPPPPQRKRAHTGSFSQIVSILGEVKLVNTYIRYSWLSSSHM